MIQKIISSASEFIKMQVMLTFEAKPPPLPWMDLTKFILSLLIVSLMGI